LRLGSSDSLRFGLISENAHARILPFLPHNGDITLFLRRLSEKNWICFNWLCYQFLTARYRNIGLEDLFSYSNKSFLFSLYNIHGFQPTKLKVIERPPEATYSTAMRNIPDYGPFFSYDLRIVNHANTNPYPSYAKPYNFEKPDDCPRWQSACRFFTGTDTFNIDHIEVFYLRTWISEATSRSNAIGCLKWKGAWNEGQLLHLQTTVHSL